MPRSSDKFISSTLQLSEQLEALTFPPYDDTLTPSSTIPPSAQPDKRRDDADDTTPFSTVGVMKLDLEPMERMIARIVEEKVDKRLKRILEIVNMLAKHLGLVGRGS